MLNILHLFTLEHIVIIMEIRGKVGAVTGMRDVSLDLSVSRFTAKIRFIGCVALHIRIHTNILFGFFQCC